MRLCKPFDSSKSRTLEETRFVVELGKSSRPSVVGFVYIVRSRSVAVAKTKGLAKTRLAILLLLPRFLRAICANACERDLS